MIEQKPSSWRLRAGPAGRGRARPRRRSCGALPSNGRQPKFAPRARPRATKSISSTASWPTSPIVRSPVSAVEREAPRVAQAVGVDLGPRAGAADERVVGRDRGTAARRSGAGRCAGSCRAACRGPARCRARRAGRRRRRRRRGRCRAGRRGRTRCWPPLWLDSGWSWRRTTRALPGSATSGFARARAVLDDARVARAVRVVDVEAARARVVGREREAEQALLAAGDDLARDVEERPRAASARPDDPDPPALLDDEDAAAGRAAAR